MPSLLRRRGFENNIVHVLYEVFTPFAVFLLAEELHVSCSDEQPGVGAGKMFDPSTCVLSEQFRLSREYIEMITAGALSVELDKIGELQGRGEIDEGIAQQLRQNVYVLQMNAEAE